MLSQSVTLPTGNMTKRVTRKQFFNRHPLADMDIPPNPLISKGL
jgi:hypothetical protein